MGARGNVVRSGLGVVGSRRKPVDDSRGGRRPSFWSLVMEEARRLRGGEKGEGMSLERKQKEGVSVRWVTVAFA